MANKDLVSPGIDEDPDEVSGEDATDEAALGEWAFLANPYLEPDSTSEEA